MRLSRVGAALVGAAAGRARHHDGDRRCVRRPVEWRQASSRRSLTDGYADNAPWAARLFVDGQENCSATIIAPTWILTASTAWPATARTRSTSAAWTRPRAREATGVNIQTNPSADLALVELDHAVTATYSPLGNEGRSRSARPCRSTAGAPRAPTGPEIECQSQMLKVADVSVTVGGLPGLHRRHRGVRQPDRRHHRRRRLRRPDVRDGSGRPYVQVGVASTSDRPTFTAYGNITQYRDWIAGIAGV